MAHFTEPFRFGAKAVKAGSAKEWTDIVRQVEDLGYAASRWTTTSATSSASCRR